MVGSVIEGPCPADVETDGGSLAKDVGDFKPLSGLRSDIHQPVRVEAIEEERRTVDQELGASCLNESPWRSVSSSGISFQRNYKGEKKETNSGYYHDNGGHFLQPREFCLMREEMCRVGCWVFIGRRNVFAFGSGHVKF